LETIGGGVILDNMPPRVRRKQPQGERLTVLATGNPAAAVNLFVRETLAGCPLAGLVPRLGLPEVELRDLAVRASLKFAGAQKDWLLTAEQLGLQTERIQTLVAQFHARNPILPGMPKEQLRAVCRTEWPDDVFDWLLGQDTRFVREGEVVRLSVHQPTLSGAEAEASRKIEHLFLAAGLQAPDTAEVLKSSGIEPKLALTILHRLIREGRLVKVGQDLVFHKQNLGEMVGTLQKRRGTRFSVAEFKDWTGVSRKYAIPLLEFLDRQRITRRDGDHRVVL
jgi:selenocysteine-specific elongation factor